MNTPNNLEWLDELLPCISCGVNGDPADGFGTCTCGNEAKRTSIATKLSEAYKQGFIDGGIATLTNDKDSE